MDAHYPAPHTVHQHAQDLAAVIRRKERKDLTESFRDEKKKKKLHLKSIHLKQ